MIATRIQRGHLILLPGAPARVTRVEWLHDGKYVVLTIGAVKVTVRGDTDIPLQEVSGPRVADEVKSSSITVTPHKPRVSDPEWRGEQREPWRYAEVVDPLNGPVVSSKDV